MKHTVFYQQVQTFADQEAKQLRGKGLPELTVAQECSSAMRTFVEARGWKRLSPQRLAILERILLSVVGLDGDCFE